jgi:predicted transcriptional regulator
MMPTEKPTVSYKAKAAAKPGAKKAQDFIRTHGEKPRTGPATIAQIKEALQKTGGLHSAAAAKLGVTQSAVSHRVANSPELQQAIAEIKERTLDLAEGQLIQNIVGGNMTAIIFYLKCKGKDRGYIERRELTGAEGGPVAVQMVDVDKKRAILEEVERFKWAHPELGFV